MDAEPPSLTILQTLDTSLLVGCFGIVVLLFCTALVSGAEVAFFSLTQKDLDQTSHTNNAKLKSIELLIAKPKKLLATLLIANNFINIGIILLFSYSCQDLFKSISNTFLKFAIEVILVSFLILLFGEVLPKIYANRNNFKFAVLVVYPVVFLDKLLSPISLPMRALTVALQKRWSKQKSSFSVDQLSQALELTNSEETSFEEQKILEGIVSFGNTDVKQVMSPRIDIFSIEINETFETVLAKVVETGFSRIPVYKDNIDAIEGVLFIKDLIPYIDTKNFNWVSLLRKPFFVPENKKLDNLLKDFQGMKSHMAIVVDEYGGTSGLISLEDILEEIVGDISDEFDDENINYSKIDDKNFIFEGKIYLKDFYRIIDVNEDYFESKKGEAETLAGLILEILGNFPKKGQQIDFDQVIFKIEAIDKKRVKQIKVTLL